jgi:hypothetical protein
VRSFKKKVGEAFGDGASVKFEVIPKEMWGYPEWIDKEKARKSMQDMKDRKIQYGGVESYHHMCRFQSGYVLFLPHLFSIELEGVLFADDSEQFLLRPPRPPPLQILLARRTKHRLHLRHNLRPLFRDFPSQKEIRIHNRPLGARTNRPLALPQVVRFQDATPPSHNQSMDRHDRCFVHALALSPCPVTIEK